MLGHRWGFGKPRRRARNAELVLMVALGVAAILIYVFDQRGEPMSARETFRVWVLAPALVVGSIGVLVLRLRRGRRSENDTDSASSR